MMHARLPSRSPRRLRTLAARGCAVLLLVPLLALPALPAGGQAARKVLVDEVLIAVNDRSLTRREVEEMRRLQAQELRQQFSGAELQTKLADLERSLDESLVEQLLLESYAHRAQIEISDATIDERVDNILRRQPALEEVYSDEQLKSIVLNDLLRRRVLSREVDAKVQVSQADLLAACRAGAQQDREVEVGHILLTGSAVEARAKLAEISAALSAGAPFEDLALKHSQDPSVSTNKGRLGFISRGQFVKEFEDAAFSLPLGAVSGPISTQFGTHLIKVFDARSKAPVNCDKMDDATRDALYDRLFQQRRQERLVVFMKQLRQGSEIRVGGAR